ncbi:hypothetical protein Sjap_016254 [Stephania japonica]|uniref:Uncharacterized protein n=1 Tax=Stephania japonica TaxID=461633 RepID=A0AAP0NRP1_9MAGN
MMLLNSNNNNNYSPSSSSSSSMVPYIVPCNTSFSSTNDALVSDGSEFFPSEPSDSGLLEEVIQGFFPKPDQCSANNKRSSVSSNDALTSVGPAVLVNQEEVVVNRSGGFEESDRDFGWCFGSHHQRHYHDDEEELLGFGGGSRLDGSQMNGEVSFPVLGEGAFENILQYPELFEVFASKMQNAGVL